MPAALRPETSDDIDVISEIHRAAFKRDAEANLVIELRKENAILVSLVALQAGSIVGHIYFSRLRVTCDGLQLTAAALGPVAVRPEFQRKGIGAQLVWAGTGQLGFKEIPLAVVLGDPHYYERFRFSVSKARQLLSPYAGDSFMALELKPDALGEKIWKAEYPSAFQKLGV